MNIPETIEKGKKSLLLFTKTIFWPAAGSLLAGIVVASTGLIRLSKLEPPVTVDSVPLNLQVFSGTAPYPTWYGAATGSPPLKQPTSTVSTLPRDPPLKLFVASTRGTSYYYAWCTGAKTIAEKNRVWFESRQAAEAAGFKPSKSCKELTASTTPIK